MERDGLLNKLVEAQAQAVAAIHSAEDSTEELATLKAQLDALTLHRDKMAEDMAEVHDYPRTTPRN